MELIINVPDITYKRTLEIGALQICKDEDIYHWIANGTPLPKGHGRIGDIDSLLHKMKERDEDNGGEPLNAVDRGYHLAVTHLQKEIDSIKPVIEADKESTDETTD